MEDFYKLEKYERIEPNEITIPFAKEFLHCLNEPTSFCTLIECSKNEQFELIVVDADIEVPQAKFRVNDIRPVERLAFIFSKKSKRIPEVLALRASFPKDLLHLTSVVKDGPGVLCIYADDYHDVKITLTPIRFISDIRRWLSKSAVGELHQDIQPLEPVFVGSDGIVIVPKDLYKKGNYDCTFIRQFNDKYYLRCHRIDNTSASQSQRFVTLHIVTEPIVHSASMSAPYNLFDLKEKLDLLGVKTEEKFAEAINNYFNKITGEFSNNSPQLLIILIVPKKRDESGIVENYDQYCFLTFNNIVSLGVNLGLWQKIDNKFGQVHNFGTNNVNQFSKKQLTTELILSLAPVSELHEKQAQLLNNTDASANWDVSVTAIGAGALGSQVFNNISRTGIGKWIIIDKDILLPHNSARHHLGSDFWLWPKASNLAALANRLLSNSTYAKAIDKDILENSNDVDVQNSLQQADIILDMSASMSVPKYLATLQGLKGKIISAFFNPAGDTLIVLAEDLARQLTIDNIEMQYYKYLLANPTLAILINNPERVRFAPSCRDLTSTIPQSNVAILSGICSREIQKLFSNHDASATIWQLDTENSTVTKQNIPLYNTVSVIVDDWTVVLDQELISRLSEFRQSRLPNETGGILVGSYDYQHRKIYLVDTIFSPADSVETPAGYERGLDGVKEQFEKIQSCTGGILTYIGEWHSHPRNSEVIPSIDDMNVLYWLREQMKGQGFPAVMLILGDDTFNTILI